MSAPDKKITRLITTDPNYEQRYMAALRLLSATREAVIEACDETEIQAILHNDAVVAAHEEWMEVQMKASTVAMIRVDICLN